MSKCRRRIPAWMSGELNSNPPTENLVPTEIQKAGNKITINCKRVLRSNSNVNTADQNGQKQAIKEPDFIKYTGAIHYFIDGIDIACACDELITEIEKREEAIVPLAFDMEWPFSFKTGAGKTSVIQVCLNEDTCYVFQVSALKKIPAALYVLLAHKKVRLHGVNIKNDIRKLKRDFPELQSDKVNAMIGQCLDLGPWCNEVCNTGGRWSLERLVRYICNLRIDKNKKVRMSQWHVIPLSDEQKLYAAIDVYISQVIYKELERREKEKLERTNEFLEEHGEKSLKVLKSLDFNFFDE